MNIEEMIMNGATEEEIAAALAQIKEAKARKDEEEAKAAYREDTLECARMDIVNGILGYIEVFELNDGEILTQEDVDQLVEAVKKVEKLIPVYARMFEALDDLDVEISVDERPESKGFALGDMFKGWFK